MSVTLHELLDRPCDHQQRQHGRKRCQFKARAKLRLVRDPIESRKRSDHWRGECKEHTKCRVVGPRGEEQRHQPHKQQSLNHSNEQPSPYTIHHSYTKSYAKTTRPM